LLKLDKLQLLYQLKLNLLLKQFQNSVK